MQEHIHTRAEEEKDQSETIVPTTYTNLISKPLTQNRLLCVPEVTKYIRLISHT